ncbi:hypothetical protein CYMTET_21313 [Cymbomonas tetramitiformis]|uniref:Reverse transcriptase RNase H-like domain-containing protein n=1 Tax=Cymbomonas tetramitiformis TaxID=36881 RepID=A0AAE0L334_9CHLO|nr:hypothetical protein CYMTET_21313 [Cymbomonas tetramitiformis]
MSMMTQQMTELSARVEVAEEAAAKAASQGGGTAQSGDAELEALKQLPYVPHVAGNPFPTRPATLESDMPQMYDLCNDKTFDALSKRTNSSMRYEQLVLVPALSYMHDAIAYSEGTMDWLMDEKEPPTFEELGERVYTAHNTFKGVFALLSIHYTMLQLRASMESDATVNGGSEALRAKLAFSEERVYAGSDWLVTDSVRTKWLKEFDTQKPKAVINTHAKASSKVSTFRDRQGGKGKGGSVGGAGKVRGPSIRWNDSPRMFVKGKASARQRPGPASNGPGPARHAMQCTLALRAQELASLVLVRLGLERNEKKGHWAPTQLVEHLGLEVDLKAGQFHMPPARLQKIRLQAKARLSEASRQRRWLPAQKLAAFAGLCQSRRWHGRKIWRNPTTAKAHTDSSLFAWGGVLDLKHTARWFWSDELNHLHITHMELEAVYKMVQSFLRELPGKLVRLYCDNQAVVAMVSQFTWWNPELMRRMRRVWILLDLNDIEMQASGPSGSGAGTRWTASLPSSRLSLGTTRSGTTQGCRVKVYWPVDDAWYTGTVGDNGADGLTHVAYVDGDQEDLDMSKEKYEVLPAAVQEVSGWDAALQERWRGKLGDSSLTELAVQMQGAALGGKTVGNYWPKARALMAFCEAESREWLPATGGTVRLYIAHMLDKGIVQVASMQPYLSTINNYHEDMGYSRPAKGRGVSRAVKGMSSLQVQAADAAGEERTVRTWLPARHVSAVHALGLGLQPVGRSETELLRACAYVVFAFVTFGRPDTGVSMLRTHISIADGIVSEVLHKEKGGAHVRLERKLAIPAAGVQGLVQLLQHWEQLSSAIHSYIDPTAAPDEHMEKYFGWTTPRWRELQPGTGRCA